MTNPSDPSTLVLAAWLAAPMVLAIVGIVLRTWFGTWRSWLGSWLDRWLDSPPTDDRGHERRPPIIAASTTVDGTSLPTGSSGIVPAPAKAPMPVPRPVKAPTRASIRSEPTPDDFGLTAGAVAEAEARWAQWEKQTFRSTWLLAFGGSLLWFCTITTQLTPLADWIGGAFCALFLGFTGMIPATVVLAVIDRLIQPLRNRQYPLDAQVRRYKEAQQAYQAWLKEEAQRYIRTQRSYWLGLSGTQFERELANLYSRLGFQVQLTPPSGDHGVDLLLRKDDKTIIVQCKAHDRPVGPAVARELLGTMTLWGADRAVLASLSGVTPSVTEMVKGRAIELLDLAGILQLQISLR